MNTHKLTDSTITNNENVGTIIRSIVQKKHNAVTHTEITIDTINDTNVVVTPININKSSIITNPVNNKVVKVMKLKKNAVKVNSEITTDPVDNKTNVVITSTSTSTSTTDDKSSETKTDDITTNDVKNIQNNKKPNKFTQKALTIIVEDNMSTLMSLNQVYLTFTSNHSVKICDSSENIDTIAYTRLTHNGRQCKEYIINIFRQKYKQGTDANSFKGSMDDMRRTFDTNVSEYNEKYNTLYKDALMRKMESTYMDLPYNVISGVDKYTNMELDLTRAKKNKNKNKTKANQKVDTINDAIDTYIDPDYTEEEFKDLIAENKYTLATAKHVYLKATDNLGVGKIGQSGQDNPDNRSTAGDNTQISTRFTYNALKCEAELKKAFNEKYILYKGSEYYIGSLKDMDITFNEVVDRCNREHDIYLQNLKNKKSTYYLLFENKETSQTPIQESTQTISTNKIYICECEAVLHSSRALSRHRLHSCEKNSNKTPRTDILKRAAIRQKKKLEITTQTKEDKN